jgi:V/A-type H+-transporting ATPase subunit C
MDYGYLNARVKGMKGRLLGRKALDELIMKPDVDSLIAALEETPYREDIEAAGVSSSGVYRIELALRQNFTRTFRKILGLVEGDRAETYMKIFLQKWDVQNVKTILRGKSIHAASEEIFECLLPVGALDEVTLTEMIRQPDVKSVIDLLATWRIEYARPLTKNFNRYQESRDLLVLENALDQSYYSNALAGLSYFVYNDRIVRDVLALEIDVINIKTVLRLIRDGIGADEAKRFLIEGGRRLDVDFLLSLVNTKSLEGALKMLEPTRYAFLASVPGDIVKKGKISDLEKLLDRHLILKGISAGRGDPLSIAVPIGFFWAKYNEVTNLRIISRCKTAGMSDDQVKEELTYA